MSLLERLDIYHFRNIKEWTLRCGGRIHLLFGKNGQGKTSFLEAIHYLAHLKSFRKAKNEHLIMNHFQQASVRGSFSVRQEEKTVGNEQTDRFYWRTDLRVEITREPAQKKACIDEKTFLQSTRYLAEKLKTPPKVFHTVVFNPNDHDLMRGEPSIRRSYLDQAVSSSEEGYLENFQKYQKILQQRNALLKSQDVSFHLLESFSESFHAYGSWLVWKRLEWWQKLLPVWFRQFEELKTPLKNLKLCYFSSLLGEKKSLELSEEKMNELPSLADWRLLFLKRLQELVAAERQQKISLVGPHRDDWMLYTHEGPLQGKASQGEIRSILLALKLSEIEFFSKFHQTPPLFLLDDFSSELDQEKRSLLLQALDRTQVQAWITSTEKIDGPFERCYQVSGGRLIL